MSVLYAAPGDPGLIITDHPCDECEWPETITKMWADGHMESGCARCERIHPEVTE